MCSAFGIVKINLFQANYSACSTVFSKTHYSVTSQNYFMRVFTKVVSLIALFLTGSLIANAQRITMTIAGSGVPGYTGDNGSAKLARIGAPQYLCSDPQGNVYFVDAGKIRQVSVKTGIITTIAGGGTSTADGIAATNASISSSCICCDPSGNLYIVAGNKVRIVNTVTDMIYTFAGTGTAGYNGDGSPATATTLGSMTGITSDASGNIYVVDNGNHRIREINGSTHIVTTIAGTGVTGYTGDGGPATAAKIASSQYIGCSPSGDIYFIDQSLTYIRKITAATGYISTFAGQSGGSIAGCLALNTDLSSPSGMCVNSIGDVCFNETSCSCREIYNITDSTQFIGGNYSNEAYKDDTNSLYAWLNTNYGLTSDGNDNLYIADDGNNRIRKLIRLTSTPVFAYGQGQTINPCPGYSYVFDSIVAVADLSSGVNETWTVVTPPVHGSITGLPASAASQSTRKTTKPTGATYTPLSSYTGPDSFKVSVSNGTSSSIFTIYAFVQVPSAGTISGTTNVCVGGSTVLHDTTVYPGIWSASNSKATINATSGTLTGVIAGTDTITYTLSATCPISTSTVVTVNPLPATAPITGSDTVCVGATITLSDAVTGGTWSKDIGYASGISVASSTGIITGTSYGIDSVIYTISSTAGCTSSVTKGVTVYTIADPISSAASVCLGSSIPITEDITGGTWSLSNGNATITGSGTSIAFTGVVTGVDTVMYTNTNSCGTGIVKMPVTISPLVAPGIVAGPSSVCVGSSIVLSTSVAGGTWSDANGDVFVYGIGAHTGEVDGNNAGVDTVYYGGTCASSKVATVITVNDVPGGVIPGPTFVCVGSTITLTDAAPGGTWSASNAFATVTGTGAASATVTGVSQGTDIISYSSTNACGTGTATKSIAVDSIRSSSGTISGATAVCAAATISLTHSVAGGVWSITNANATIGPTGIVTGITPGIDTVHYIAACALTTASAVVTVNPLPGIATPTGGDTVCIGGTIILSDTVSGGAWSSTAPTKASVSAAGFVTGVSYGSASIRYTTSNGLCTASATKSVTVFAPVVALGGASFVCLAAAATVTETVSGGVWSMTNGNATISSTAATSASVTGMLTGTDTVVYTNTNMCGTGSVTKVISVNPPAVPGTISGASSLCPGASTVYTETTPGGTWSMSNLTVATIRPALARVYGVTSGTDTVIYTVNSGCNLAMAKFAITIGGPSAGTITGGTTVCAGTSITLADGASGGVWSATNGDATISGGVVNGLLPGLDTIHYSVSGTCGTSTVVSTSIASQVITVTQLPDPGGIAGPGGVCIGTSITLMDAATGGVWSDVFGNATVSGTGSVIGVTTGSDVIQYTVTNACGTATASQSITIDIAPNAGTITGGAASLCMGTSVTLADTASGGAWHTATANASVSGSGTVTGITVGTDVISYTVTNACGSASATQSITIDPLPDPGTITSADTVCIDATITLIDPVTGGMWSANNGNASVSGAGVVTGTAAGSVNIQYAVTNSCGTANATQLINVVDCNATGINTVSAPAIKIFPNPASSVLDIEWNNLLSDKAIIVITDVTGRVVLKTQLINNATNSGTTQLNVSNLSDGVYLFAISSDDAYFTAKVVVSNR